MQYFGIGTRVSSSRRIDKKLIACDGQRNALGELATDRRNAARSRRREELRKATEPLFSPQISKKTQKIVESMRKTRQEKDALRKETVQTHRELFKRNAPDAAVRAATAESAPTVRAEGSACASSAAQLRGEE